MKKTTVKSFVKQFEAFVKGDDATVIAEKTFRQATSALKSQIASLEGDLISKEDAVEEAIEAQTKARINSGTLITNKTYYVENLLRAKNNVTQAQEALELHIEKIAFLNSELAALETEVEA